MPKYVQVVAHITPDELEQRYRKADDPVEWSQLQIVWLLARDKCVREVAEVTGYPCQLDQDCCPALQAAWPSSSC
jgi:hypothetical protein